VKDVEQDKLAIITCVSLLALLVLQMMTVLSTEMLFRFVEAVDSARKLHVQ